ncbi:protein FAM210B [Asbolus verrucosus]|uniref:Protein FAM210B n=1 Tax=Asbolus verrucosus TaxID=1661398 RepID=A0A482VTM5_ASBVE|nr:protein FAM210B [Asbolus verrucosus]
MFGIVALRSISRFHSERSVWLFTRNISHHRLYPKMTTIRKLQSDNTKINQTEPVPLTAKQKLKKAVAEYGSTVIIFHVTISLVSLGTCYLLVSSGLDGDKIVTYLGISGDTLTKVTSNAGTFAVAYAVHKVFAPVRIMTTLAATPLIVRYLRNIGVLRKAK